MALPANVSFGTVTARFIRAVADSTDSDRDPDGVPLAGLTIKFTPSVTPPVVKNTTSTPPVSIILDPVSVTTDDDGVLIGPDGVEGVRLVATDDPDLDPTGWTWKATVSGSTFSGITVSFALPSDGTVDLATVIPVPANPGTSLDAWQAAVDSTQANVVDAQTAATQAEAAAASLDVSSFVKTVNDVAPDEAGNVVVSGGGSATWGSISGQPAVIAAGATAQAALDAIGAAAAADVVPDTRTINGKPLSADVTLAASDVSAVPTTRTVAGKPLSGDVALVAGDVGAVPTTRTVAGKALSADVTLAKTDVGLSNVDNTSDVNKPVSTAQQAALDAQAQQLLYDGTAWPAGRVQAAVWVFDSTGYPSAPTPDGGTHKARWIPDKDSPIWATL